MLGIFRALRCSLGLLGLLSKLFGRLDHLQTLSRRNRHAKVVSKPQPCRPPLGSRHSQK
jgi:hypothetical protein